jgi:type III pantothenate kinase
MNLLAFDIGNSDITIGYWDSAQWKHVWRLPSGESSPVLFYVSKLRDLLLESEVKVDLLKATIISSVVPDLTYKIIEATRLVTERESIVLGPALYSKLPIRILNPTQIGSDLVANALAAYEHFKEECLVVDFGTALTFTTVSTKGEILGVAITPGLKTAIKALTQNTAKLFEVPLVVPSSALGKDTTHAIQAGVLLGYENLVTGMIDRIRHEMKNSELKVVATGGLSSILPAIKERVSLVSPTLTLDGLRHAVRYGML